MSNITFLESVYSITIDSKACLVERANKRMRDGVEEALTTAIIEGDDLRLQALLDRIAPPFNLQID
jgi:hypothetical protein